MVILAIDPGRDKCGIAVLMGDGQIIGHELVLTSELEAKVKALGEKYSPARIILGNGTTSEAAAEKVRTALKTAKVAFVDEYKTTEEARGLYWECNPPKGLRSFLPLSLLVPPVPVDDYAAAIIGRRWLKENAEQASADE